MVGIACSALVVDSPSGRTDLAPMPTSLLARFTRRLSIALLLLTCVHVGVHAQSPAVPTATLTGCTYDSCAIRLDRGIFGGPTIRIGLEGTPVRMGSFGGQLAKVVLRVPAAEREARAGRANAIRSYAASTLSAVAALTLAFGGSRLGGAGSESRIWTAVGVSALGGTVASVQNVYAGRHYSRAVWLYNREIPR
jgi:hypothetical protein